MTDGSQSPCMQQSRAEKRRRPPVPELLSDSGSMILYDTLYAQLPHDTVYYLCCKGLHCIADILNQERCTIE